MDKEIILSTTHYYSGKRSLEISTEYCSLSKEELDLLNKSDGIIKEKGTIYIDSKVKINRNKIRDAGFKIVRDVSKADMILFDILKYQSYFYSMKYTKISDSYTNISDFISKTGLQTSDSTHIDVIKDIIDNEKIVYMPSWQYTYFSLKEETIFNGEDNFLFENQFYNYISSILENHAKIISLDSLYKENIDSVIIDEEMYKTLYSLFESSDKENHVIALQTLANCDYNKSAPYILAILEKFDNRIYNLKERNHVNFKELLNFFHIKLGRVRGLDGCIKCLEDKKLLNLENINILINLYSSDVLDINSHYLKVNRLVFTDKIIDKILISEKEIGNSSIDENYLKSLTIDIEGEEKDDNPPF